MIDLSMMLPAGAALGGEAGDTGSRGVGAIVGYQQLLHDIEEEIEASGVEWGENIA